MLKDVSTKKFTMKPIKNVAQITVLAGSTEVYQSNRTVRALASGVIKPGQTVKVATLWSGKANRPGVKKLSPGTYTIQVDDDGYLASTTVQIGDCHAHARAKAAARGGTPILRQIEATSHRVN